MHNYLYRLVKTLLLSSAITFLLCSFVITESNAFVTSYWVADAHGGPGGSLGKFGDHLLNDVYIDPSITNWIAWHDKTTPDVATSGQEYVGDYGNWLGIDDYMYVTITNPGGVSYRRQMDYNNAYGGYSGIQAVIYGSAGDAPNVSRAQGYSWPPPMNWNIDEAGLFNDIFTSSGVGNYDFRFEFYNGYSGSYGNPNFYLLVDAESAPVPLPATMLLLGSGLIGLVGFRKKFKK